MKPNHLSYFIGLFDVLGFEARFEKFGLSGIAERYSALVDNVTAMNAYVAELEELLNISDEAILTDDGDAFVFNRVNGVYASDSILLWAHAHFPEARALSESQRAARAADPAEGWMYQVIPCDRFLEACNQLLCNGLEIGLPLRGAVALGPAIIDERRAIFLGRPLIDAARAEKGQKIIGAALVPSFVDQTIPSRFLTSFAGHVKHGYEAFFSEHLLDWPRHWRRTRSQDLHGVVEALDDDPQFSVYYDNTQRFIALSASNTSVPDSISDWSIRATYPQFSAPELRLKVRAVRGVAQQRDAADAASRRRPCKDKSRDGAT